MRFLQFALNGIKLTVLCADGAANALVRIDIGLFPLIKLSRHGTGRADIGTGHTANALAVVDFRQIADHLNGTEVTGFRAGRAADTGVVALGAQGLSLLGIVAVQRNDMLLGLHGQYMLRADVDAALAALTLILVHHRDVLFRINMNCVKRTDTDAASQSETGIGAGFGTVVYQLSGDTVLNALIAGFVSAVIAIALAGHG